jgi:transposase
MQAKLCNHLWRHFEQWFVFLFEPTIEPTNWREEQAIRPAVVNWKVFGGNRTVVSARTQSVLMWVMETVRRSQRSMLDDVSESLRAYRNPNIVKPTILLGR